jgi:uncharacterized protein
MKSIAPAVKTSLAVALLLCLAASGGAAQTVAPSFNCSKATGAVEKLVCNDDELASTDQKVAELYRMAEKKDPNGERAKQRQWMKERSGCASSSDMRGCLLTSYQQRSAAIQIELGMLQAPKTVAYDCPGLDQTKPVTIAYYNDSYPPSAVLTYGNHQVVTVVQPSGSGARYGSPGVEFWEHQGEARFTWDGRQYTCKPR